MNVQGCDCSIVIKTAYKEFGIPYSEETIREAISLLQEEASIEGNGICKAIKRTNGVTGCIITPLTIGTAPLLLCLAMGSVGLPMFVSETRDMYQYRLSLLPMEDTDHFDLIQDRQGKSEKRKVISERRLYEGCRVQSFELRIMRDEVIKLKLDICGEYAAVVYPYTNTFDRETGERFNGDCVKYRIDGKEYSNIYGLTLLCKKEGGIKTEIWIKRVLNKGADLPEIINEVVITAQLLRDKYEYRHFGTFTITAKRLVLIDDETTINSIDTVVGPLRYYVAGMVTTEVFSNSDFLVGV
jgi:hypothetical protein